MNARKNNDRCDQKAWQTFYASKNILSRVCDRVNVIHPILFSKNFITFFALRCLLSRFFTLFLYSPHLPENIFITSFSPPQTKNLFHRQINCGFSWNKIKKKMKKNVNRLGTQYIYIWMCYVKPPRLDPLGCEIILIYTEFWSQDVIDW